MDKFNIKYNDLNNENYEQYYCQIKNKLFPQNSKSFYLNKNIEKESDDLFINHKIISLNSLISYDLIEDSSDEISSDEVSNDKIKNI